MTAPSNIDPRLGAASASGTPRLVAPPPPPPAQYGQLPQQKPPSPARATFAGAPAEGLRAEAVVGTAEYAPSPPQPYYHYPAPPHPHATPQQPSAPTSSGRADHIDPEHTPGYPLAFDGNASPDHGGGSGVDGQHGDDIKRPRACEACRGLKVRCDQDPERPDIPCKRCAKAGRACVITQPSRKRQKKADNRVAELEKKLDAMMAWYQSQQGQQQPQPQADALQGRSGETAPYDPRAFAQSPTTSGRLGSGLPPQKRRRTEDDAQATPSYNGADAAVHPHHSRPDFHAATEADDSLPKQFQEAHRSWLATSDDLRNYLHGASPEEFVDRINSIVPPDMASTLFNRYVTKMAPHLPAVVFPPSMTAQQLFNEKPILYVSVLCAASNGFSHPDTFRQLASETVGAIADCVVRNGAKSLELIQAMQVIALWYKLPEDGEQTNFYQIIHMAAVMALDIGLERRFSPAKVRRSVVGSQARIFPSHFMSPAPNSNTLEARRAWLMCYFMCSNASMVLRRPNLVHWTNYMKECIEVLESHPDAFPSDKIFCQHIKIQHICEDIGLQFLMDDNTADISITDPKVTYTLNLLNSQLKNWKESVPPECRVRGLEFFEHGTRLYLHEIALHFNHNTEDFRVPFTEESLKSVNDTTDALTQNQVAAMDACLKSAHGILDTMLSYDDDTIKCLPMLLYFVRCIYAIAILIKMHVAICTPNSELGKMMKPEDLKIEYYIEKLVALFSYVTIEGQGCHAYPRALHILEILRVWYQRHQENVAGGMSLAKGQVASQLHDTTGKSEKNRDLNQTPLHLLSQVATGNKQDHQSQQRLAAGRNPPSTDWTFDDPAVFGYTRPVMQRWAQQHPMPAAQQGPAEAADAFATMPSDQTGAGTGMVDPTIQDFGWSSGFEQAMDMAMVGVDGLQGGELDSWFLGGESLATGIANAQSQRG